MNPENPPVILQKLQPDLAVVILNRPEAANALNRQMAELLKMAFDMIAADPAVRVVILAGQGEKAFCGGADLKERKGMDVAQWQEQHATFEEALHAILLCEVPVIAAVNGAAFGGGLELALACDFIYAVGHARFALTETTLGIMPGLGGVTQLARAIGHRRAKELLYTGNVFTAHQAHEWGLVNRICESAELFAQTMAIAQRILAGAPLAIAAVKAALSDTEGENLEDALDIELQYYNELLESFDRQEGISAFNEKRKPNFTGS